MPDSTRRLVLAGMASWALASWAEPLEVSDADAQDIRATIQAQLAAFRADDAELAFSYATPGIRAHFVVADYFMAMVRGSYPVVYRPETVGFLLAQVIDGAVIQRVRMTDRHGAAWLAIYRMQQQQNKATAVGASTAASSCPTTGGRLDGPTPVALPRGMSSRRKPGSSCGGPSTVDPGFRRDDGAAGVWFS